MNPNPVPLHISLIPLIPNKIMLDKFRHRDRDEKLRTQDLDKPRQTLQDRELSKDSQFLKI